MRDASLTLHRPKVLPAKVHHIVAKSELLLGHMPPTIASHQGAATMSGLPSQHASQETWKPPASTLAHRLAVIHPTSGCVGPKGLSNQVNAATRCRSGWTRQAPHTRPAVCEQTSHKLQQTTLDLFVGRAKASRETTPMSSRAQPDTAFAALILMLLFLAV